MKLSIGVLSVVIAFLVIWSVAPYSDAAGSSVIRTGNTVSLAEEQLVEGDYYSSASKLGISGEIQEDLVAAAAQITMNGSVGADAFLFGGQIDVHGSVGDDLRVVGGEVIIGKPVNGDLFVVGGTVNILSTASISGDVIIYAGEATIEGSVGGKVMGSVSLLRIDSEVSQGVDVSVGELTLGSRANVAGSVVYTSTNAVIRAEEATIGGDLVRNDPVVQMKEQTLENALVPVLILLFSVLVWYWVSQRSLRTVVDRAISVSVRPFLIGFIALILTPFLISLLMISVLGAPISFVLLFGYLLFITLSVIGIPAVLGQLLLQAYNRSSKSVSVLSFIIGIVAVGLLTLLPMVGPAVLAGFMVLTLGSIIDLLIKPDKKTSEEDRLLK